MLGEFSNADARASRVPKGSVLRPARRGVGGRGPRAAAARLRRGPGRRPDRAPLREPDPALTERACDLFKLCGPGRIRRVRCFGPPSSWGPRRCSVTCTPSPRPRSRRSWSTGPSGSAEPLVDDVRRRIAGAPRRRWLRRPGRRRAADGLDAGPPHAKDEVQEKARAGRPRSSPSEPAERGATRPTSHKADKYHRGPRGDRPASAAVPAPLSLGRGRVGGQQLSGYGRLPRPTIT